MKKQFLLSTFLGTLLFTACIQEEALNSECDIETCVVENEDVTSIFFTDADRRKTVPASDSVISFPIREDADVSAMAIRFSVTEGARLFLTSDASVQADPNKPYENGDVLDYSRGPVSFRVVSQDGRWQRNYRVRFDELELIPELYFERNELEPAKKQYYIWFENDEEGRRVNQWATGNPGFKLSKSSAKPDEYPTVPYADGVVGQGVKLETRSTGGFGIMVNMRIAAGNLFIGTFDETSALTNAMKATCFGKPFRSKPVRFSGYYQFTPGKVFQDRSGEPVKDRVDAPDLYAVFYRNVDAEGNPFVLHGDDVLTSDNIIALARVENPQESTEWVHFDLPFVYREGKEVDPVLLNNAGYNLAVVFTSSIEGASFCGAIGSVLLVDEVKVESVPLENSAL